MNNGADDINPKAMEKGLYDAIHKLLQNRPTCGNGCSSVVFSEKQALKKPPEETAEKNSLKP